MNWLTRQHSAKIQNLKYDTQQLFDRPLGFIPNDHDLTQ